MRIYKIYDEEIKITVGYLIYFEKSRDFIVELSDTLDEWTSPLLFTAFVRRGIYTIPREISLLWVRERIIPAGRQNIGAILSTHRLKKYEEISFLELSGGRCAQDHLYIKRTDSLPDHIAKRSQKNVRECLALADNNVLCFFEDGISKKVDLKDVTNVKGIEKVLTHQRLFMSCKVGTGGYSITFDDTIDVPSRILYETGKDILLGLDDFISFVIQNVADTTDCCSMLECSRQNIAYFLKQKLLHPIRKNVKGNLYLKGDVLRNKW